MLDFEAGDPCRMYRQAEDQSPLSTFHCTFSTHVGPRGLGQKPDGYRQRSLIHTHLDLQTS